MLLCTSKREISAICPKPAATTSTLTTGTGSRSPLVTYGARSCGSFSSAATSSATVFMPPSSPPARVRRNAEAAPALTGVGLARLLLSPSGGDLGVHLLTAEHGRGGLYRSEEHTTE